jgi:hypothetical protein
MELLTISTFIGGMALAVACVWLGMYITLKTGGHFIENYVKKLTPQELKEINNAQPSDYIPEENLWANDVTEQEYRRMMGWEKSDDEDRLPY